MNLFTIASFLFFTISVAFISWNLTRKEDLDTNSGYFLGGRNLTGVVIAGSLMLTNLSTEQLVGMNGNAFMGGLSVMAWEATSGLTLVFMALIFLPKYLKSGITTIPEFVEDRYDKSTRNLIAILFLISLGVIFLPVVLYSGGLAFNSLFNISKVFGVSEMTGLTIMVWGIGIVGGIYAIFGGLKAVVVSDTINGVGLLIGGMLIPILGFITLGNGSFIDGVNKIIINHPGRINAIGGAGDPVPFGTLFTGILLINTFYWCTNQFIVQRTFGAKNLAEAQKGVLYAGFLKILAPFVMVVPGIIAFHLYGGDLSIGDMAYPILVSRVLPKPLVGFFAAVLFGAILSSFNSALNSASTLFCINLYKPIFKPNIKDKDLVKVGKIFGTFLAIFSMLLAPQIVNAPSGLFVFMRKFMGFFNVPTLVIIIVGFYTKRVPAIAAKVSIFTFMFLYGLLQFVFKPNIHFLHILGMLFLLCVGLMLIIGKIAPRKTPYEQKDTGVVELNHWKHVGSVSAAVIATLIFVYTLLSPLGIVWAGEAALTRFLVIFSVYFISMSVILLIAYFKRKAIK
ncbi:solute:sodium symporter family transporter [Halanaerobium hydrogeniformans]|uniref:SSS sodium solute transporter superfamily n=1 Tax=Halanaerobium hydrogeniformans TaxID=656519 RepID=E4RNB4_HALHG|nr:solute:sodium symporter family transporter [Halanaerobium hydrogeniformans]ADQ13582.1 SSS sodium solute transporter superfamily [Halanaerobium hydrogeniformans]